MPSRGGISPAFGGNIMMEYTGNFFTVENSVVFNGDTVNVLEYRDKSGKYRTVCCRCGKPLRYHWWTIQTADDDVVYGDIGAFCVNKLT